MGLKVETRPCRYHRSALAARAMLSAQRCAQRPGRASRASGPLKRDVGQRRRLTRSPDPPAAAATAESSARAPYTPPTTLLPRRQEGGGRRDEEAAKHHGQGLADQRTAERGAPGG